MRQKRGATIRPLADASDEDDIRGVRPPTLLSLLPAAAVAGCLTLSAVGPAESDRPAAATPSTKPAAVPLRTFDFARPPSRPKRGASVVSNPPSREVREYDRATMPPEVLQRATRAAYTWQNLAARTWWWDTAVRTRQTGGQWEVLLRVDALAVELWCHATIFLPGGDACRDAALVAHENGHRRIGERVYRQAQIDAGPLAEGMKGLCFVGKGPTADAAIAAARQAAADVFYARYSMTSGDRCMPVQAAFDRITDYGQEPAFQTDEGVARAVDLAFEAAKGSAEEFAYRRHVLGQSAAEAAKN